MLHRIRIASRLAALVAAAFIGAAGAAPADDLRDAQKLYSQGKLQPALEKVDAFLKAQPRDPQGRFLKGLLLTEQKRAAEAIQVFTALTEDYPELPEPYNNLAVIYASQGQYEKARAALEKSIRTHPSYATAYENLGDVYAKLASQAYDKALQLDSSNSGAKNKLSLVRELVREPAVVAVAKEPPKPKEPAKPPVAVAARAPEKPAADANAEVLKAVNGWAEAWSKKDANAYLSYYAGDFKTPGGEARPAWEKTRRERIAAPKSIEVKVDSPKVTLRGSNEASVTFRQDYRSDKLTSSNTKTLELVKTDGRWQIREEKAGK